MMAKRFFYVCGGLLCLALAYHLGATTAQGQASLFQGAHVQNDGPDLQLTVANGHTFYRWGWNIISGQFRPNVPEVVSAPVPGAGGVIGTFSNYGGGLVAVLDNGDVYFMQDGVSWQFAGSFNGGPTPVQQSTFGALKARYR